MSDVRVRRAVPADAAVLADMANDLNTHVGIPTRPFTAEGILADGFGPDPAFSALVAELDDTVVGYAFFRPSYNTDVAARCMWLIDLFVAPAARSRGAGRALMAALAAETVRAGLVSLDWAVHMTNTDALAFYHRLGAAGADVQIMGIMGDRLRALARETP